MKKINKGFYVRKDDIYTPVFFNKDGNPYIKFDVEAKRSINPLAKRKADEVVIIGMPMDKFKDWCLKNGYCFLYRY